MEWYILQSSSLFGSCCPGNCWVWSDVNKTIVYDRACPERYFDTSNIKIGRYLAETCEKEVEDMRKLREMGTLNLNPG